MSDFREIVVVHSRSNHLKHYLLPDDLVNQEKRITVSKKKKRIKCIKKNTRSNRSNRGVNKHVRPKVSELFVNTHFMACFASTLK